MPNFISEDQIEKAIIQIFENNLGYRHSNCMDKDVTGRLNENEVVIKPLLKKKIEELNKHLPASAIDQAFEEICKTRLDKTDLMAKQGSVCFNKARCTCNHQKQTRQRRIGNS